MPPANTPKQTSTARRSVDASRPSSSAAAKARSTETADGTRLSVQQQCFLQALLARGIMDSGDAESLYREIVEDDKADDFMGFWGEIAIALKFLDLEIRATKFEDDGRTYMAVVNNGATQVAKLATRLSPQEIALFRIALDEILRDDETVEQGIHFMSAMNYTELQTQRDPTQPTQLTQRELQTQTVQKMSKTDKEATLNQLIADRWLSHAEDGERLRLGPRSFLELREFILDQAPERARERWNKLF